MKGRTKFVVVVFIASILFSLGYYLLGSKPTSLNEKNIDFLNVSYDATREFYSQVNNAFEQSSSVGRRVHFEQSNGGSGAQARAVTEGLQADIVTLGLSYDINQIAKAGLLRKGWENQFPYHSTPYTSTIVFLVRKGNPKGIHDWNDLARPGIGVITANPKTSGGARWAYLAALAYANKKYGEDSKEGLSFLSKLYHNVIVFDTGARGSTTTFVQRRLGDVLMSWENEAFLSVQDAPGDYEIVRPSISILTEPPVAIVDSVVDRHGTRDVAREFILFLYSKDGQEIAAKNYFRPRDVEVAEKYKDRFPVINMVTIGDFGGWDAVVKKHFSDNGVFDSLFEK